MNLEEWTCAVKIAGNKKSKCNYSAQPEAFTVECVRK